MNKEQIIELLDYLEKAQDQWHKNHNNGVIVEKINWNFVKDTVREYNPKELQ